MRATLTALSFALAALATAELRAEDGGVGDAAPVAVHGEASGPQAMAGHIMVEVAEGAVRLTEVYVLVLTERLEPPAEGAWLPLPEEALSVEVERGVESLRVVDGGLTLTAPLEPGRHPLAFSFIVPAESGRAIVAHQLPFSVGSLHVMWQAGAPFSVQAMGFADRGVIQMGPRSVRLLERAGLERGGRVIIVTTPGASPQPPRPGSASEETRDPLAAAIPVTLTLAILLLLAGALLPVGLRLPRSSR